MPYPSEHLYLTVRWTDTREADETGQVGIRFDSPIREVVQESVNACAAPVETFWRSAGANIPQPYRLHSLRLALIGVDGKYPPGTFSRDYLWANGPSTTNTTAPLPMQVASVATFTTENPSGQASRGRIYLPPFASSLATDGRWSTTLVDARAAALSTMLQSLNQALSVPGGGLPAIAAVFSKGTIKNGAGARSFIRGVKIGTRPDVQRRRAKSQREVYGTTSPVPLPV